MITVTIIDPHYAERFFSIADTPSPNASKGILTVCLRSRHTK